MVSTFQASKQTRNRPSCIRLPNHNHVLMVYLPEATEQIITASDPEGLCFAASYIHAITGEVVPGKEDIEIHIPADHRIYFVASSTPSWYFVVQWSSFYSRFGCSCLRGKQYAQTHEECEHMLVVAREVNA